MINMIFTRFTRLLHDYPVVANQRGEMGNKGALKGRNVF